MKCPKCAFVSNAGLDQCERCGYPFVEDASQESSSLATPIFSDVADQISNSPLERLSAPSKDLIQEHGEPTAQPIPSFESAAFQASSSKDKRDKVVPARRGEPSQNWKDELSERVESYRKRRGRLEPDGEPERNLELDFGASGRPENDRSLDDAVGNYENRDSAIELDIQDFAATQGGETPSREILSTEELGNEMAKFEGTPAEDEEMSLGEPLEESQPMEILVGTPTVTAHAEVGNADDIYLAPLGRRFMAGLTDALVLALGATIFGIIFWRFCGQLSLVPLNIAVLGLAAIIVMFAYFAVFTAIASATPGLLWMGCEIRNLSGDYPTTSESFWRAFGVLVSLSALTLGFLWACVDSDTMSWHDRMSGTVITVRATSAGVGGSKVDS